MERVITYFIGGGSKFPERLSKVNFKVEGDLIFSLDEGVRPHHSFGFIEEGRLYVNPQRDYMTATEISERLRLLEMADSYDNRIAIKRRPSLTS